MKNALTETSISVDRALSRCDTAEERNCNVETLEKVSKTRQKGWKGTLTYRNIPQKGRKQDRCTFNITEL